MKQRDLILSVLQAHPGRWFLPQDFMREPTWFVGYEASARLSEIAKEFPKNVESKREGRQMARRWVGVAMRSFYKAKVEYVDAGTWREKEIRIENIPDQKKALKEAEKQVKALCLGRLVSFTLEEIPV